MNRQGPMEPSEDLVWIEQTRMKIEKGVKAVEQGAVFDAEDVLAQLRRQVEAARSASA